MSSMPPSLWAACPLPNATVTVASPQDRVTREWNAMAGEWDDIRPARMYAQTFYQYCERKNLLWPCPRTIVDHTTADITETTIADNTTTLLDKQLQSPTNTSSATETTLEPWIVLDFGCGTGLFVEQLQEHYQNHVSTLSLPHRPLHIVAVDASPHMIDIVQDKILSRDWHNVQAVIGVVAHPSPDLQQVLDAYQGRVHVIVTNSLWHVLPREDWEATLQALGRLLVAGTDNDDAPSQGHHSGSNGGGLWIHSDWPLAPEPSTGSANVESSVLPRYHHPCGSQDGIMKRAVALEMYAMAGLQAVSMHTTTLAGMPVFVGIARKLAPSI
jgi:SAM-dependent methyltransferase